MGFRDYFNGFLRIISIARNCFLRQLLSSECSCQNVQQTKVELQHLSCIAVVFCNGVQLGVVKSSDIIGDRGRLPVMYFVFPFCHWL